VIQTAYLESQLGFAYRVRVAMGFGAAFDLFPIGQVGSAGLAEALRDDNLKQTLVLRACLSS
jgi:hypothetical protein